MIFSQISKERTFKARNDTCFRLQTLVCIQEVPLLTVTCNQHVCLNSNETALFYDSLSVENKQVD